jgi:catechol 2,3-dioxygenase-like lactoylglutathione lyase family enzyme
MSTQENSPIGEPNEPQISLVGITLRVGDVDRALEFYTRIPGTRVVYHRKGEYAVLAVGKGQLGLVSRPVPTHVEIDAPDPDALYEHLKEAGLPVTELPEAKGWGDYTFVMYDQDGNCLEFSRPRGAPESSW